MHALLCSAFCILHVSFHVLYLKILGADNRVVPEIGELPATSGVFGRISPRCGGSFKSGIARILPVEFWRWQVTVALINSNHLKLRTWIVLGCKWKAH